MPKWPRSSGPVRNELGCCTVMRRSSSCCPPQASRGVTRRAMNARILSGSFSPGARSTPEETSTAGAAVMRSASAIEKVELSLPKGVSLTSTPDKTLSGMIASGELDCVIIARPPNSFREKHPDVVRLFPDYEALEQRYYEKTRVYPIMHVIAMRKSILEGKPWVARNLYNAFEESRRRSLERILDPAVSRYPVPWLTSYALRMQEMFGGDLFPYGIEPNRPTLELFLRYVHEQGIAHSLVKPEDIFPAGIMAQVKI